MKGKGFIDQNIGHYISIKTVIGGLIDLNTSIVLGFKLVAEPKPSPSCPYYITL
jgi:hypothetical protein